MMGFVEADNLWLLATAGLFAALAIKAEALRQSRLRQLALREGPTAKYGWILQSLVFLALALALARPYWGVEETEVSSTGRDVMALLDVSASMLTRDVSPSRLVVARRKLLDLVKLLEKEGKGDRLGIVLFAGTGYLFCPLTADYGVLQSFINAISTDLLSAPGTDLSKAISIAMNSLREVASTEAAIVVLSDGEDLQFDEGQARQSTTDTDIKIFSLGIGTSEGKPIELSNGKFVRDTHDNIVVSRLDEENLRKIVSLSPGLYQRLSLGDEDLRAILAALPLEGEKATAGKLKQYGEMGPFLLGAALLTFLAAALGGSMRFLLPVLLACLIPAQHLRAEQGGGKSASAPNLYEAYRAYKRGDFETALQGFEPRAGKNEDAKQALGATLFRRGDYEQARRIFDELSKSSTDGRRLFDSLFNLGNAELMLGNFQNAIQAYERALEVKPGDHKAIHNRALAEELLRRQLLTPTPTPPPPQGNESQASEASSADSQSSASNSQTTASTDQSQSQESSPASTTASQSGASASQSSMAASSAASQAQQEHGSSESPGQEGVTGPSSAPPHEQSEFGQGEKQHYDPQELKKEQAKMWLDSLPDSPVLLMKKKGSPIRPEQTW